MRPRISQAVWLENRFIAKVHALKVFDGAMFRIPSGLSHASNSLFCDGEG
jgi:hypothetical protein